MIDLHGTPYLVSQDASAGLLVEIRQLEERIQLLRSTGKLTDRTLWDYYGERRFEQIAESNALEGSPLTVGETTLAVLKGITLTGHDPGWSRDAQALDRALNRLTELARDQTPTGIAEVKEINELVLGDRPSGGIFRNQAVRISGSQHTPPENWREIMDQMEGWQRWSTSNTSTPSLLRAAVLHSWLVFIHPFADGNGRTARAIANLEFIRAGYPPIIIRKNRDRDRYIDGLHASDEGDLTGVIELFQNRLDDALRDLERAAQRAQGYNRETQAIRKAQEGRVSIWNSATALLADFIQQRLTELDGTPLAEATLSRYETGLTVDDYITLCSGQPISKSWCFKLNCVAPGLPRVVRLAWLGYRSRALLGALPPGEAQGPSVYWSEPNPGGYPPWRSTDRPPGAREFTLVGDQWLYLPLSGKVRRVSSMELADVITTGMLSLLSSPPTA